jgi:hypothetical protein
MQTMAPTATGEEQDQALPDVDTSRVTVPRVLGPDGSPDVLSPSAVTGTLTAAPRGPSPQIGRTGGAGCPSKPAARPARQTHCQSCPPPTPRHRPQRCAMTGPLRLPIVAVAVRLTACAPITAHDRRDLVMATSGNMVELAFREGHSLESVFLGLRAWAEGSRCAATDPAPRGDAVTGAVADLEQPVRVRCLAGKALDAARHHRSTRRAPVNDPRPRHRQTPRGAAGHPCGGQVDRLPAGSGSGSR